MDNSIKVRLYDAKGDVSKRWFVYYYETVNGQKKRIKDYGDLSKFKDEAGRRARAIELINELTTKLQQSPSQNQKYYTDVFTKKQIRIAFDLVYYLNKYIEANSVRWSHSTKLDWTSIFKRFCTWCETKKIKLLREVTEEVVTVYFTELQQTLAGKTINTRLAVLKHAFCWFVNSGYIKTNPFDKIKKFSFQSEGKLPFSYAEADKLKTYFKETDLQLYLFVQFMYYTLARPNEIRQLKIDDINLSSNRILFRGDISKNKKSQYVVIPPTLRTIILEYDMLNKPTNSYLFQKNGGGCYNRHFFSRRHTRYIRELGYSSNFSLYSWKSTGAIAAVKAGVNIKDLKEQLRHSSLDMTDIYLRNIGVYDSDFTTLNY